MTFINVLIAITVLPKALDEEVARAHLKSLNVKLTTMVGPISPILKPSRPLLN